VSAAYSWKGEYTDKLDRQWVQRIASKHETAALMRTGSWPSTQASMRKDASAQKIDRLQRKLADETQRRVEIEGLLSLQTQLATEVRKREDMEALISQLKATQ
tara:strand:+ start:87 stop:395 length:309 start_codon:yes stop_codon:yes gene_type:complete